MYFFFPSHRLILNTASVSKRLTCWRVISFRPELGLQPQKARPTREWQRGWEMLMITTASLQVRWKHCSMLAWYCSLRWAVTVYCILSLCIYFEYPRDVITFFILCYFLCLFSVKSAFSWCVDKDLLEMNDLISPQDYLTTQKPRVEAPAASTWPSLGLILNY